VSACPSHPPRHVRECVLEAVVVEGLEQVVHGLRGERPQRVAVVRGDEHDRGQPLARQALEHAEAVEPRHLHVEEQQVGRVLEHRRDGERTARGLGDHAKPLAVPQQLADARTRRGLVVRDHDPERLAHAPLSMAIAARAASRVVQGSRIRTATPEGAAASTRSV
jgi:hypothetical protein